MIRNQLLQEIESDTQQNQRRTICLLTRQKSYEERQRLHLYAEYLCHLLNAQIQNISVVDVKGADKIFFGQKQPDCDLTLFGEPDRSFLKRLISGPFDPTVIRKINTTLLVAREPRWPIKRILYLLRFEETDQAAFSWLTQIAIAGETKIIILPLIPTGSELWIETMEMPTVTETIIEATTRYGQELERISQHLNQLEIEHEVHFQQGTILGQAQREVKRGIYDLIVMGAEPPSRLRRWVLGEIVTPLLQTIDHPILVAKAGQTDSGIKK